MVTGRMTPVYRVSEMGKDCRGNWKDDSSVSS